MPYFVYRIYSQQRLEPVDCFDAYRPAKQAVRAMREAALEPGNPTIRMIFANNPAHAERLLTEKREPRALGEE